jgi:hypothetical protein
MRHVKCDGFVQQMVQMRQVAHVSPVHPLRDAAISDQFEQLIVDLFELAAHGLKLIGIGLFGVAGSRCGSLHGHMFDRVAPEVKVKDSLNPAICSPQAFTFPLRGMRISQ